MGAHRQMFVVDTEREQVDPGADDMARQGRNLIDKFRNIVVREKPNESAEDHYKLLATGPEQYFKSVVRAVREANEIQQKKPSKLEVKSVVEQVQFNFRMSSEKKIFSVSWCPGKEQLADCLMKWTELVFNLSLQSGRRGDDQESLV